MPADTPEHFDILVVGGGPAGAAAARHARQLELSALVIEKNQMPRAQPCAGWLGPTGVRLAEQLGLTANACGAKRFTGLTLHNWEFKQFAVVSDDDLSGWLVERSKFDAALLGAAEAAGAIVKQGTTVSELQLADTAVRATLSDNTRVTAGVLLIADGAMSQTAERAQLLSAGRVSAHVQALFFEYDAPKPGGTLDVALGPGRGGQLATFTQYDQRVRLSVTTQESRERLAEEFRKLITGAAHAGRLPTEFRNQPQWCYCPAGVALDLDSHVGKRALMIGDAGGFVATFSREGVFPAMRSGLLAAEAAQRALAANHVQDELSQFDAMWRQDLADYLRTPNTDLSLLLPLVFNNEQMSRRVARAFLLGETF